YYLLMTPTVPTYSLSLHDALPISLGDFETHDDLGMKVGLRNDDLDFVVALPWLHAHIHAQHGHVIGLGVRRFTQLRTWRAESDEDRKSTRLNSSHVKNSYAVFWLK